MTLKTTSVPQELFSVKSATVNGAKVLCNKGKDVLVMPDGTRFDIQVFERMYYLETNCGENDACNVSYDLQTWHKIMGHCNYEDILNLKLHITGAKHRPVKEYNVCIQGKFTQIRNRAPSDKTKTQPELDLLTQILLVQTTISQFTDV